jgi:uncharacterized protein YkwD
LRRHRALTHLLVVSTALAVVVGVAIPAAPAIQAGLMTPAREGSILPANVGVGVPATAGVELRFPGPMDPGDVGDHLGLAPGTAIDLAWSDDATTLTIIPRPRWATDERYVVFVPAGTRMADGGVLAADWQAAFTTQAAPRVTAVDVAGAPGTAAADTPGVVQEGMTAAAGLPEDEVAPGDIAADASAATAIGVTFSAAMDQTSTEAAFRISPAVAGAFRWTGTTLWFEPEGRLIPDTRYSVTLIGARDAEGNLLGGDTSFSLTTRPGAQALTLTPTSGARGVTGRAVQVGFSLPMDREATTAAFRLVDVATGQRVTGNFSWSADDRTLTFTPSGALRAGRTYAASLGAGAADADGNPVAISWRFTTAGATRAFTPTPAVPAGSDMTLYALAQVNASRAAYGLGPLVLDAAISAVAYGHAADMLANGYFSHDSLDGTTYKQRLTRGGISYGWSGENICYLRYGGGVQATLNWCHSGFMSEPYPGYANHIGNILSTHFRRVGIGIAVGGDRVIVAWDFTD